MASAPHLTRRRLAVSALAGAAAPLLLPGDGQAADAKPKTAYLMDPELLAGLKPPQATPSKSLAELNAANPRVRIWEEHIPGAPGAPPVRILVCSPRDRPGPVPGILYIHGGGYIRGDADMYVQRHIGWEESVGAVVVSVDYRLAPQTRFPGSLEDNYAALTWLHGNAKALGVDPQRIAVGGGSAGGGHAAALSIYARDKGEVPIAFQLLIYPMLDDRTGATAPADPLVGEVIWTAEQNRQGWGALLGVPAGSASPPPGAVPARVEDLSRLPPAYIGVGSLDLFRDEDMDYARRLLHAGVPVTLEVIPGAYHGFDVFVPEAKISRAFRASVVRVLRKALAVDT